MGIDIKGYKRVACKMGLVGMLVWPSPVAEH